MSGENIINPTSSPEEETHAIQYERDTVDDLKVSDLFHSQHKQIMQTGPYALDIRSILLR
ncbi:6153_t:CDS:2 [Acaulospora morrowiae]|uniref:6153_t:CDS:1 n=1 Tax=Acaulospora morrowiae TaxID=94023 RepID=A0A9N8ZGQ6_9GLOM|nr:6153_t:CDS:2 [Acaulospora morrowiae]